MQSTTIRKTWLKELKECGYDNRANFLWIYIMKGCCCGSDNETDAWEVFKRFHERTDNRWDMYEDNKRHLEVLVYWMNSLGLIEHGGSIAGSWLSEDGEWLWEQLHSKNYTPSN